MGDFVVRVGWKSAAAIVLAVLAVGVVPAVLRKSGGLGNDASAPGVSMPHQRGHDKKLETMLGNPGPWGQMLMADVEVELPDEYVQLPGKNKPVMPWLFKGCTRSQALDVVRAADMPPEWMAEFSKPEYWKETASGAAFTPPDDLVMNLPRVSRAKLYASLVGTEENQEALDPIWFRPESFERVLEESHLSPASVDVLKKLIYHQAGSPLLLFADRDVALRQLADDQERRLFIKAISRKSSVMARLILKKDSDVNAMANYWGVGGRRRDILPMLRAIQRSEDGWNVSMVYLLPYFVRNLLMTYPNIESNGFRQDCFWTAFNTFCEEPDNGLNDMAHVREVLNRDYHRIFEPSQLGDLILLTTPNEVAVHAAVYIADDLVFTKNGYHYTQPWICMRMRDMQDTYHVRYPNLTGIRPVYFRKKGL